MTMTDTAPDDPPSEATASAAVPAIDVPIPDSIEEPAPAEPSAPPLSDAEIEANCHALIATGRWTWADLAEHAAAHGDTQLAELAARAPAPPAPPADDHVEEG